MENIQNVVIAAAKRTPIGSFQGSISTVSGPDLGSRVIGGILEETVLDPSSVDEVKKGDAAIEERARTDIGMIKEGEEFYLITQPKPVLEEANSD